MSGKACALSRASGWDRANVFPLPTAAEPSEHLVRLVFSAEEGLLSSLRCGNGGPKGVRNLGQDAFCYKVSPTKRPALKQSLHGRPHPNPQILFAVVRLQNTFGCFLQLIQKRIYWVWSLSIKMSQVGVLVKKKQQQQQHETHSWERVRWMDACILGFKSLCLICLEYSIHAAKITASESWLNTLPL